MMGISCIIVVRPRAALGPFWGKKFFGPKFNFFNFFFLKMLSFSHFWSQSSETWSDFGVTMTLEFDEKKF